MAAQESSWGGWYSADRMVARLTTVHGRGPGQSRGHARTVLRMAAWQRCDRCRRVLQEEEFDGDSTTCRACLTVPVKAPSTPRSGGTVTRSRTTPRPPATPAAPPGPRPALLGVSGSGDLEVRERRARRAALEALGESHPEELALLLRDARQVEGLRAASPERPADPPAPAEPAG